MLVGKFATTVKEQEAAPVACRLGKIAIDAFDEEDRQMLTGLLSQRRWSDVCQLLKAQDFSIEAKTVAKHGRGNCICSDGVPGKGVIRG